MRIALNRLLQKLQHLDNGYDELPITSEHAVTLDGLPPIHRDRATAC